MSSEASSLVIAAANRIAGSGSAFTAAELARACGCSDATAQTVLGKMVQAGTLVRPAYGYFAAPGAFPKHKHRPELRGHVSMARGETEENARYLAEVDAFLSSREQWPGGPVGLPKARMVDTAARRHA